ncbi:acetate--CoA ligase family protein [candidate division KSB1 bacterium]|nr:acetate--CoA ligase family protein [candidate division KSB1 bacterium]
MNDLQNFFTPSSIAVIGASRTPGAIGREMLRKLVDFGFNGAVYPVNPKARFVQSMKCYRSVLEIPDPVDLAIICVPKQLALQAVEDCGRKEVKSIIMITAGFGETGATGAELEQRVFERVRSHGMRMIGPNCMGVINTDPKYRMDATFAGSPPWEGKIGFLSQSGALGVAILDRAAGMRLGLSSFVSLGNKTDVSTDDVLGYWLEDPRTELVLLYIESFGNPQRFTRIAREMVKQKPIIAVKSGRTRAGARAASSHTASLAAADVAVDALFESAGVMRVDTVEVLFDLAQAFARQPLPKGPRVGVMSNGGGPAILATDAVVGNGLKMATFSPETINSLRSVLAEIASASNPVDMIAMSGAEHFERVANLLLDDENVDALLIVFVAPVTTDSRSVAEAIARAYQANRRKGKPVLVCFMTGDRDTTGTPVLHSAGLPVYIFPESAAQALAAMNRYRQIRERSQGEARVFDDVDRERVRSILEHARLVGRTQLSGDEVSEVLAAWRFPTLAARLVERRDELSARAKETGFPLVMKIAAEGITHKSDVGGVKLNLRDESDVLRAWDEIATSLKALDPPLAKWAVTLEPMISGGRELVLGINTDPAFGPMVMVGMGGIYVEVLKDVAFRLAPLTELDIEEMVKSLRGYKILAGVRGEPSIHFGLLHEALARLSYLSTEFPEIQEMDVNPFLSFPERERCVAVDARISLRGAGESRP